MIPSAGTGSEIYLIPTIEVGPTTVRIGDTTANGEYGLEPGNPEPDADNDGDQVSLTVLGSVQETTANEAHFPLRLTIDSLGLYRTEGQIQRAVDSALTRKRDPQIADLISQVNRSVRGRKSYGAAVPRFSVKYADEGTARGIDPDFKAFPVGAATFRTPPTDFDFPSDHAGALCKDRDGDLHFFTIVTDDTGGADDTKHKIIAWKYDQSTSTDWTAVATIAQSEFLEDDVAHPGTMNPPQLAAVFYQNDIYLIVLDNSFDSPLTGGHFWVWVYQPRSSTAKFKLVTQADKPITLAGGTLVADSISATALADRVVVAVGAVSSIGFTSQTRTALIGQSADMYTWTDVDDQDNALYAMDGFRRVTRGIAQNYTALSFASSDVGWAVTQFGRIFKTMDGGQSWQEQPSPVAGKIHLLAVHAISTSVVYASGHLGCVMKTADGGTTWSVVSISSDKAEDLVDGDFLDSATKQRTGLTDDSYYAIQAADANTLWVGGSNAYLAFSTDAGVTWTKMLPTSTDVKGEWRSIIVMNAASQWQIMVGGNVKRKTATNSIFDHRFVWIADAAGTPAYAYVDLLSGSNNQKVMAMYKRSATQIIAVCLGGQVIRISKNIDTGTQQINVTGDTDRYTATSGTPFSSAVVNQTIYATGFLLGGGSPPLNNGFSIVEATNGTTTIDSTRTNLDDETGDGNEEIEGWSFTTIDAKTARDLTAVWVDDAETEFLIGTADGRILRSANNGVTWITQRAGDEKAVNAIVSVVSSDAMVVAGPSSLLYTSVTAEMRAYPSVLYVPGGGLLMAIANLESGKIEIFRSADDGLTFFSTEMEETEVHQFTPQTSFATLDNTSPRPSLFLDESGELMMSASTGGLVAANKAGTKWFLRTDPRLSLPLGELAAAGLFTATELNKTRTTIAYGAGRLVSMVLKSDGTGFGTFTAREWGTGVSNTISPPITPGVAQWLGLDGAKAVWSGLNAPIGDAWDIPASYRFAARRIVTEESPSILYRSGDDDSEIQMLWDRGDADVIDAQSGGAVWDVTAAALFGTNFKEAYFGITTPDYASATWPTDPTKFTEYHMSAVVDSGIATGEMGDPGGGGTPSGIVRLADKDWIPGQFAPSKRDYWLEAEGNIYKILGNGKDFLIVDSTAGSVADASICEIFTDRMMTDGSNGLRNGQLIQAPLIDTDYRFGRIVRIRIPIPAGIQTDETYFRIGTVIIGRHTPISVEREAGPLDRDRFDPGWRWQAIPNSIEEQAIAGPSAVEHFGRIGQRWVFAYNSVRDWDRDYTLTPFLPKMRRAFAMVFDSDRQVETLELVRVSTSLPEIIHASGRLSSFQLELVETV